MRLPRTCFPAALSALALTFPLSAVTLLTENFDTDGEGSRYTSSTFDDGGSDFFERQSANPDPRHLGAFTFTAPQGGSYWSSEDIEDAIDNPLVDHAIVRLDDLDVTGHTNLKVRLFLATTETTRFDIEDIIEIQVAADGDSGGVDLTSGTYTTIGRFIGNAPDIFGSVEMKEDSDLDGIVFGDGDDAASATLNATMQEFIFDVPFPASTLSVQVRIEQNGGSEEIAFDHIRIEGDVAVTDPPALAAIEAPAIMLTEGDPATQVTNTITVSDPDSTDLTGATVSITAGFDTTEDVLAASPAAGITPSYNSATGILTLSGTASLTDYQSALRSVTYQNTDAVNPSTAIRTIRFQASDGSNSSNFQTRNVQITAVVPASTIPYLEDFNTDGEGARYTSSTYRNGSNFFERSTVNPVPDHGGAFTFTPPQGGAFWASEDIGSAGNPLGDHGIVRLPNLDATGLSTLQVTLYLAELAPTGEGPEDKIEIQYAFDGDIPANPTDLSSGTYATVGRFVPDSPDIFSTGAMTLDRDLDGVTNGDAVDDAPAATLSPTLTPYTFDIPATGGTLSVQVRLQQNGGNEELAFDHIEVTGSAVVGTPPTLAALESPPLVFTEGDPDLPLTGALTVADPDPSGLASATVQITGNFDPSEDFLADDGSVPGGISVGAFNPGTGTLTLTGAGTPADYQTALRAITYGNSDPVNPSPAMRTVTFQAFDADGNPSNTVTRDIQVVPILPTGVLPVTEDFETDGNGERYVASTFNTGPSGNSFFERVTANPDPRHSGAFTFTAPQGGAFLAAEDIEETGNPLGDHGIIRLRDLDVTDWIAPEVTVYLGQLGNTFDLNDKIEIQYALDGDSGGGDLTAGTYTTVGRFVGDTVDEFGDGPLTEDADLNGVADPGGATLTGTMTAYTFPIPDGADLLSVQVRVEQNGGSEEIAIDHLTVTGISTNPIIVTTNADELDASLDPALGNGTSLREAITYADSGVTILFDGALDGSTIALTSGQLVIDEDLTIDASALGSGLTISGSNASRIFFLSGASNELNLYSLHLTEGSASSGAAIVNLGGATLRAWDCSFTNNSASPSTGGGIYSQSSFVELERCTFNGNSAGFVGGAISSWDNAQLTATNCTFHDNFATAEGGAIHNVNGSNSSLIHCTIHDNEAGSNGGGIFRGSGVIHLENTILAENTAPTGPEIFGPVGSIAGVNLIGDPTGISGIGTLGVDYVAGSPLLAPLANNGGFTQTMLPLDGSPAIDGAASSAVLTDQRGISRPKGPAPDIGAVESLLSLLVTNDNDSGTGSLRESLANAISGSSISFDPSLDGQVILLAGSELVIDQSLTIDASGLPGGLTIDAGGASRHFRVTAGNNVTLDTLTLTGGSAQDGGAILNEGTLTINNSTLSGNSATQYGGAIENVSSGNLTIINSTISGNTAVSLGGGIDNFLGTLSVTNCTLWDNSSSSSGGGIFNEGPATITSSTLSGNRCNDNGGGISNVSTLTLSNSIVAGNMANTVSPDIGGAGSISPTGVNLIGNNESVAAEFPFNLPLVGQTGNLATPLLAPLGDYGGPTQTMHPLPGSPAIDGAFTTAGTPATDQRGFSRPTGGTIYHSDFEANDGGFTVQTNSGTDWEWGEPDSSGPGGLIDQGNEGSLKCWATNLGDFNGTTGESGYYADSSVTLLRSPVIDLTGVTAAELTFAEAMDLEAGDTAVLNVIDDTTNAVIAAAIYTATDGDTGNAPWAPANGGTPIDLSPYTGQAIRLEWSLTGFGGATDDYLGWYIDDVSVVVPGTAAPDIGAVEVQTSLVVLNDNDSGAGSLREAIVAAAAGGTITFDPTLDGATIGLTSGELLITKDLSFDGSGLPGGVSISAGGSSRLFFIQGAHTVNFTNLTFRDGGNTTGSAMRMVSGANVTIDRCLVTAMPGPGLGALSVEFSSLDFINSTLSGCLGGTVSGIRCFSSTVNITHSTISANGNGSAVRGFGAGAVINLSNTVVADNAGQDVNAAGFSSFPDATVNSLGGNLIGDDTNFLGTFLASDWFGTAGDPLDPLLSPLANNGGPTQTMLPLATSPAIDNAVGTPSAIDQRGLSRPFGPASDIGAVEGRLLYTIATTADNGAGSLREAIAEGDPGALITFDPSLDGLTIPVTSGRLFITGTVTIDASSLSGGLILDAGATDSNQQRVIEVAPGGVANLLGLTITGGYWTGSPGGAGVFNRGEIALTDCLLTGNTAIFGAAATSISNGEPTQFTMIRCTVSGNSATANGGGILNWGANGNLANMFLQGCTLSGNTAPTICAGLYNYAGNGPATLTAEQCTSSGNTAATGTGAYNWGAGNVATMNLTHCTISDNSAGNQGGGLRSTQGGSGTALTNLLNTIIAGNTAQTAPKGPDIFLAGGTITSSGGNLIGKTDGDGGTAWLASDLTGTDATPLDPLLAPLSSYGGPTETMALLPGSPALEMALPTLLVDDQRGAPRPIGAAADIGAYEVQPVTTHTASTTNNNTDTWQTPGSWDNGIPTGFIEAVIQTGKEAHANSEFATTFTVLPYSGNLLLETGSTLKIFGDNSNGSGNQESTENIKALGGGTITMEAGSFLRFRENHFHVIPNPIVLTGDNAKIRAGESTAGAADLTFTGGITGAYDLILEGNDESHIRFAAANSFASVTTQKISTNSWDQNLVIHGDATGSLGGGNVTIIDQISLEINAVDSLSDTGTLSLAGSGSLEASAKLVMNASDTVNRLFIDGVQQPAGVYDNSESWLDGLGTLTVLCENTFACWIADFDVGAFTAFTDDSDGDGQENGLENFFGTDPGAFSTGLVATGKSGNTFTFTHPQNPNPADDIVATYLWTKDLQNYYFGGDTDGDGTNVVFTTQLDTPVVGTTTVTATVTGTATPSLYVMIIAEQITPP